MTYLSLDKTKLVNLEYSLLREVIRTNRAGSYSSTTVVGCNTRKYHGMLVCPIEHFNGGRFVLLSSLDISLIQHQQVFNLGIHKYQGSHYEPKGHKYMTEFEMEVTPKRIYRVGGMLLSVEQLMVESEEQVLLKVTLEDAHSPTLIRFKPFLAFRSIHDLTQQNMVANTRYQNVERGIKIKMYEGFPFLHMQTSKENEFLAMPDWYRGIEYTKEQNRGYPFKEDLFSPGYFEMKIDKGESIIFSAATSEIRPNGLKAKYTREINKRIPRDTLLNNLLNSAEQFIQKRKGRIKLVAGYHWYHERLRDTLVALPGLMAYQTNREPYLSILDYAIEEIRRIYIAENNIGLRPDAKDIDVPLWLFYTIQEIEHMFPEMDVCKKYSKVMIEIIQHYMRLKDGCVRITESGLLYAKVDGKPLTWMDAVVDGKPVTWRPGLAVEVNALWYNALCCFVEHCSKQAEVDPGDIVELTEKVRESFVNTFWNEEGGYLFDYVDGEYRDAAIRPNQVLAASLRHSPLSTEQKKAVIDVLKKELLTPKGLRTLSPSDPQYKGVIEGPQSQRDVAKHQGSVFPWLSAFFADGYLSIHKRGGLPFIKNMIDDFEEEMGNHCISTISEYFNGTPPHVGKGAVSMAWNVAAVIKIINLIEKYN
ncbi:MAG TPA: glycogen debranching protein [Marinilabiliaceae bacterium]|nr:glycogen debranching protein [Marinilabiliaceae bacterium]